jgi:hypothetical protein
LESVAWIKEFRRSIQSASDAMGHRPSYADPDVWLRPAAKPDGFEHCEHVLCHVDDVLLLSHDPVKFMRRIQKDFKLNAWELRLRK